MRIINILFFCVVSIWVALASGCAADLQDLRVQNDTQRKRIVELESQMQVLKLKLDQQDRKLETADGRTNIELDARQQRIAALELDLARKKALIESMQQQLLQGGMQLPVELNDMLQEFAKSEKIVTYDSGRGVVKFESDLLFDKGSDSVAPAARKAIESLCAILNSQPAQKFDIVVAGHTDDLRISKPETRRDHPTNWHLSVHRAISVLQLMNQNGLAPERISVRGFGEYRPIAPNKPEKKGNPLNRRVEIYIVPKGM